MWVDSTIEIVTVCMWRSHQLTAEVHTVAIWMPICLNNNRPSAHIVGVAEHIMQGPDLQNILDYLKFIIRSAYDSGLKHAQISLRNIASYFTNTFSDDFMILLVNHS